MRAVANMNPALKSMRLMKGLGALCLAAALAACGTAKPKPTPLGANVPLFAVSQVWTASIGSLGAIQLTPAVQGDSVTLATASGEIASFNAATGASLWRTKLSDKLAAGVGSDGTTYVVVTAQNEVVALRDGAEQWRHRLPARSYTAPFVAGGRVFVLTADRTLIALDAQNGAEIWSRERDGEPLVLQKSGVLLAVGNTLVTGYSGRIAGVSPDTGSEYWDAVINAPRGINDIERLVDPVGRVSRERSDVCVQAFQSAIGCVDASRGVTRWTQRVNGSVGVHGDTTEIFSVDNTGRVQAWDRYDGKNVWMSDRLRYRDLTAPLLLGRAVVVGDESGTLHLLSRQDGSPLNRFQLNSSGISVAPVVVGNTLIAVTNNGSVFGFRPD